MQERMKNRTRQFAVDVVQFCKGLANRPHIWIVSKQLMRSATSVGANYRAACRAQSRAAFIAKMAIVEEEADESLFWLEIIDDLNEPPPPTDGQSALIPLHRLQQEARELLAIASASKKTARANRTAPSPRRT